MKKVERLIKKLEKEKWKQLRDLMIIQEKKLRKEQ
jgi:hypothetical protein